MTKSEILNRKPLIEAIFEIRWELTAPNPLVQVGSMPTDPLYEVSVGVLKERLRKRFPAYVRLPAASIPGAMMPHQPQHQLRDPNGGWPLVQIGPGLLTVNETDTYTSSAFIPMCLEVLDVLKEFWMEYGQQPRIIYSALRYIDALELETNSISDVLAKLDVKCGYGERVNGVANIARDFHAFNLSTRVDCTSPAGYVDMTFNRGLKGTADALIWEMTVSSENEQCSAFEKSPASWLSNAHSTAHDLFFTMIQGELHEKFK